MITAVAFFVQPVNAAVFCRISRRDKNRFWFRLFGRSLFFCLFGRRRRLFFVLNRIRIEVNRLTVFINIISPAVFIDIIGLPVFINIVWHTVFVDIISLSVLIDIIRSTVRI